MTKTRKITALFAALALTAAFTPLFAGEGHKCDHEAQACLDYMAKRFENRGWAGVNMEKSDAGPTVTEVFDGTPAQKAGIKSGDVLLAINGLSLSEENEEAWSKLEAEMTPGATMTYKISRNGKEKDIRMTLAPMPAEAIARIVGGHMLEGHTSIEMASN